LVLVPPRLFALDHGFPQPIVDVLGPLFADEAELVPISSIDTRLPDLDDWQVLLALHHDDRGWDGLITTDSGMLALPRELWVLTRTQLSLVVAMAAGDDPIKATGLLFVHLSNICARTRPDRAQLWKLRATEKRPEDPMGEATTAADHRDLSVGDFLAAGQLPPAVFGRSPLEEKD
jgi:hypothetical protein